jgi:hypothetical protein
MMMTMITTTATTTILRMMRERELINFMDHNPPLEVMVVPVVKKFPAFYGTRRFITTFKIAHHWTITFAS